jgi:hypothetical protein
LVGWFLFDWNVKSAHQRKSGLVRSGKQAQKNTWFFFVKICILLFRFTRWSKKMVHNNFACPLIIRISP